MSNPNGKPKKNEPILRAVSDFVKKHIPTGGTHRIEIPGPNIAGPDMQPVALAIDRMTAALSIEQPDVMPAVIAIIERMEAGADAAANRVEAANAELSVRLEKVIAEQSKTIEKLLKTIAEKEPTKIVLPDTPKPEKERPKRKLIIKHGDDESTITEV